MVINLIAQGYLFYQQHAWPLPAIYPLCVNFQKEKTLPPFLP